MHRSNNSDYNRHIYIYIEVIIAGIAVYTWISGFLLCSSHDSYNEIKRHSVFFNRAYYISYERNAYNIAGYAIWNYFANVDNNVVVTYYTRLNINRYIKLTANGQCVDFIGRVPTYSTRKIYCRTPEKKSGTFSLKNVCYCVIKS